MQLIIYRAADAFLYLPTYIAEAYGIFRTLLKPYGIDDVDFQTAEGDIDAIQRMLDENKNTKPTMAIAIGDPIAFLTEEEELAFEDVKVIGALIDKLPFWAVNHVDKEFKIIDEFKGNFSGVIHYNNNLKIGNYLGQEVKKYCKTSNSIVAEWGSEISMLRNQWQEDSAKNAVAVTADIVSVAQYTANESSDKKDQLIINYCFSSMRNHITTGIITSKSCCVGEKNKHILSNIIKGIQTSISLLYSSEEIAFEICESIAKRPDFNKVHINDKTIGKIIELIRKEEFYPADLNISKEAWTNALEILSETENWKRVHWQDKVKSSFEKHVENAFVYESEKSIAKLYGITIDTFKAQFKEKLGKPIWWIFLLQEYIITLWPKIKKVTLTALVVGLLGLIFVKVYEQQDNPYLSTGTKGIISLVLVIIGTFICNIIWRTPFKRKE